MAKNVFVQLPNTSGIALSKHNFSLDFALKEMNGVKALKSGRFKAFKGKITFWQTVFAEYTTSFLISCLS